MERYPCGYRPFGMFSLPAEAFEEIEPTYRESDGRKLRRFILRGLPGEVWTESPMDTPIYCELIEVKPYDMPSTKIFEYEYK